MKSTSIRSWPGRLHDGLEYLGRRPWVSFFLIFSLAATIRFSILSTLPIFETSLRGSEEDRIAVTLATQGRFADPFAVPTGPSAHNPPFYPWLISLLYRAMGMGIAARCVRYSIGILAYAILYGLLPRIAALMRLPAGAGVLGGFAMAALPLRKSGETWRMSEDPYGAMALAFLMIWTMRLRRQDAPPWWQAALYGVAWGAVFYMTPSLAVTFLGLAAYLLVSSPHRWRTVRWLSLAVLLCMVVIAPWTLRNRRELGGWMFMRSNVGLELSYANNDEAQPTIGLNNQHRTFNLHPGWSEEEARRVARVGELAYNREKLSQAKAWIASHPARFLRLSAMRAAQMWFGVFEQPRWLSLPIAAFTILGWLGLATLWRGSRYDQFAVIAVLWLTYPSAYFVFQYVNRYRGVFDWSIALAMGVFLMSALGAGARRMDSHHRVIA